MSRARRLSEAELRRAQRRIMEGVALHLVAGSFGLSAKTLKRQLPAGWLVAWRRQREGEAARDRG